LDRLGHQDREHPEQILEVEVLLEEMILVVGVLGASSLLVLAHRDLLGVQHHEREQGLGLGPLLTLYQLHDLFQVRCLLHPLFWYGLPLAAGVLPLTWRR